MKRNRIASALALLIVGLILVGLVEVMAGEQTSLAMRLHAFVAELTGVSTTSETQKVPRVRASSERITIQKAEQQQPYLSLNEGATSIQTEYAAGTGVTELTGGARAHALASADFDEDGTPDLAGGYAGAGGAGVVTLQRGNVDAIYPNSPEARERRANGQFSDAPFHKEASAFRLPEAAHFIGAGDFDADGHWDVVAARRGGNALYFLRGDGRGNLSEAEQIELPGALMAFATGEMNRGDGLTDIVVSINGDAGAGVLVFESPAGALRGQPERLSMPAVASGLALGAVGANSSVNDLAIASGNELLIVHGRDRRLSMEEASRGSVPEARMSRSVFEFALSGVAIGDFAGDERADVAVLSTDGAVQVLTRAGGDESAQAKTNAAQTNVAQATPGGDKAAGTVEWQRSERASVGVMEGAADGSPTAVLLMTAKMSSLAKYDLLVMGGGRAHVITNEAAKVKAGGKAKRGEAMNFEPAADLRVSASVGAESELAAVLPMRLNSSALSSLVAVGAGSKAPSVVTQAVAATFTVNSAANTSDANRGNGECRDANGNCTLRAAIEELNSNTDPGPYTINFNISGAGVPVIATNGVLLESINKPVVIDGTMQAAGRVELRASANDFGNYLLVISGGNSTVRGLVMSGGPKFLHLASPNNIVEGCYFGTNSDGTAVAASRTDVGINVSNSNNLIGGTTPAARNVISGLFEYGIDIRGGTGNLIQGNRIGTNAAGTAAIGNGTGIKVILSGVMIGGTAPGAGNLISGNGARENRALFIGTTVATVQGNLIGTDASGDVLIGNTGDALFVTTAEAAGGTTIGGTSPAARNVIAGSTGRGIYLDTRFNDNPSYVQGNRIGTNADGTVALPNLGHGIGLVGSSDIIGGTAAGAGNLISGNGEDGIYINSSVYVIQGNLIGTDVSGTLALPNRGDGIETSTADGTLIGGTTPEARNVISGNRENGLRFGFVNNPANSPVRVEGNYIGLNRFGTGALGNGSHGINFSSGTGSNVGGTSTSAGNVIAFNGESGIASNNSIIGGAVLSNSIYSNVELGIDIGDNGVSTDAVFPNARRPTLTSVTNTGAGTVITGTIPNHNSFTPYTLHFFSNTACDPSGHGEGQTLIGQMTFTPTTQNVPVNFSHTVSPAVPGGTSITAVAIRQDDGNNVPGAFYTSEFSNCAQLAAPTPTPTPTPTPGASPTPTPTPVPLQLFVIAPARGGDAAAVTRQLTGQGFLPGITAKLTRAGQPDIVGSSVNITNNGTTLTATFDLTGKARGLWSVIVTNAGGPAATLADAFTIGEARPSKVWVDLIGRYTMRSSRSQTFYINYGNSGDVDGPATLVQLSIPREFTIEQLPEQSEERGVSVIDNHGALSLQLYIAKLPAGSSFFVPVRLKAANELAHNNVELRVKALSAESLDEDFNPSPSDPTITVTPTLIINEPGRIKMSTHVTNGAGESADYAYDHTYTTTTTPEETRISVVEQGNMVEYTITTTVPQTNENQAASLRHEFLRKGERPQAQEEDTSSLTKHTLRLISPKEVNNFFNKHPKLRSRDMRDSLEQKLTRCLANKHILNEVQMGDFKKAEDVQDLTSKARLSLSLLKDDLSEGLFNEKFDELTSRLDNQWVVSATDLIYDDILKGPGDPLKRYDPYVVELVKKAERNRTPNRDSPLETEAFENIFIWILIKCKCELRQITLPSMSIQKTSLSPTARVKDDTGEAAQSDGECGCSTCDEDEIRRIINVVFSQDPNDKVGPQGGSSQRFIKGNQPMPYSIFFENKPEATAPAQDVVITDQLDVTKFDLSTFSLGPIAFGNRVVTPPPGLSEWTTDVDLRPANRLIVRISGKLDKATGLVTWKFISLDPVTMQPTEDALAGFLPPNKTAPEGEGSVTFTVAPKASLQTGDEIRNKARIVFDANAPIDTPDWLNTIDLSKPASQVTQATFDGCKNLTVNWAGTDTGSGIAGYDVYVSENGGPLSIWQQNATATSSTFTGEQGKTYTFLSIARDGAGNVEDTPSIGDKTANVNDTTNPQLTAPAAVNALIGAGDTANALVIPDSTLGQAVASDSCSQVTVTRTGVPAGNSFTVGTHTITYTATDATGNTATATQTVTVTVNNVLPVIQLNSATHSVSEEGLRIAITVNRNGDLSLPATIAYATNDQSGLTPCNVFNGMASSRCDYATTVGTLRFAVGEGTKVIFIPVVDDVWADGTESLTLTLSNPSAASLGATTTTTITVTDNDSNSNAANPVSQNAFFVRQQYIDFLGREPEPAGLQGWLNVLNNCGTTVQQPCDRIEVSSGFFRSEEFQTRGYFIYRFYSAVGKIPLYEEFMPDLAKVSGFLSAQELEANKAAFVNEFMARSDFQTRYGALTAPTNYVDALLQTVGLVNHPSRQTWITGLTNGSLSRGQVLRALVESTEVFQKYYTEAFVIMQYFGYLRRSADISYLQWIQTMNTNGGDYRTMINGFLNSEEYRKRFGPQ